MDTRHPDSIMTKVYLVMYRENRPDAVSHFQCAFQDRDDAEGWAKELDEIHEGNFHHWVTSCDFHDHKAWTGQD